VEQLDAMEPFYPLHVRVCGTCLLVQLPAYVGADEIFTEYAYFSSYSDSWRDHARRYVDTMVDHLGLTGTSFVVEVASNDGYLLEWFGRRNIPALGIEPAANVAEAAAAKGVETLVRFFGASVAAEVYAERGGADLVVANNVLAHVPDLNDFVAGIRRLLSPAGVATFEFPHLLELVDGNQFDTIYHEHFSYFSLHSARRALARHGLAVYDVERLRTHGGSLRLYVQREDSGRRITTEAVADLLLEERRRGYDSLDGHAGFQERVETTKHALVRFLIDARRDGKAVAGYGAPGKGNTLLNFCGIRTDLLAYTVDRNPYKQGTFAPGTRIPILEPDRLSATRPDYIVILPWNLRDEILSQLDYARAWGAQFVIPIPEVVVVP
jgi:SAM-dependent methyltransferase